MQLMGVGTLHILLILILVKRSYGGTYSIIHPKLFRIDTDEGVVVNLHGYGNSNIEANAWLRDYPRQRHEIDHKEFIGTASQKIFFKLKVSRDDFPMKETVVNTQVELHVQIRFLGGEHPRINKRVRIFLTGESDLVFVQTDRPIYKPGELVSIRAVALNSAMLPIKSHHDVFEITIKTTEGVGIYKDIKRWSEFITAQYKVPDDPPLGSYFAAVKLINKTHTSTGSAEFKVEKYVLPTFNVEIELDENTVKPGGIISGKFTAKYSYGKPVVGTYGITATLHTPGKEPFEIYSKPSDPARKRPGMLRNRNKGTQTFDIPIGRSTSESGMSWNELIEAGATISVAVSVMGEAEGIMESDQKDGILITNTPYVLDMSQTAKYFIPSMTHDVNVIVRDVLTEEPVQELLVYLSYGGQTHEDTTDEQGAVQFLIDTTERPELQLTVRTKLDGETVAETTLTLRRHSSNHGYLKMSAPSHASVDSDIYVRFITKNYHPPEIFYMVLTRGIVLASEKYEDLDTEVPRGRDRVSAKPIRITRKMSPSIRVVGYFMNGEDIISDSLSIDVNDTCVSKELTIDVVPEVVKPGGRVDITFRGQPQALVGAIAVDRAAYFLNSKGRLDRRQMFEKMESLDMGCSVARGSDALNVFEEAGLAFATASAATRPKLSLNCSNEHDRRKRSIIPSHDDQSLRQKMLVRKCYKDGRKENLADLRCAVRSELLLKLELRDEDLCLISFNEGCMIGERIRNSSAFRANKQRSTTSPRMDPGSLSSTRRKKFEEGWLRINSYLPQTGEWPLQQVPPHSITTYDIDAISIHDAEGFCIAKPAKVKVFKDFFIQLYLPYSVKVMEQVQVRIAIFNYHETRNRTVILKMKTHEVLCTQGTAGEFSNIATVAVRSQSSESFSFSMIPLAVPEGGNADIELQADPQDDESARDTIIREILVEPSGSLEDFSQSRPLDPQSSHPRQIYFEFPDSDVVPKSKKCWIYGFMSYLGPIIEFDPISETPQNLDNSLGLPYGCGEQNMKRVGPNVFALNYLKYIDDATPNSREKVKTYIIDGYTRQQTHRNNGRWSVYNHAPPTIWINAYVNKVFLHAQEVWPDMDITPICQSMRWMVDQQSPNGGFSEAQHSRFYWINVAEGGEVALTAYVLITLAETNLDCSDKALESGIMQAESKAVTYLQRTVRQDTIPYTASLVAYALALVDTRHPATIAANQRLLIMKQLSGDEIFWQGPHRENRALPAWRQRKQSTIDIETTAYALLAQVTLAEDMGSDIPPQKVDMINGISRWMVNQQNDRGGFQSSQTTVVAIQAMTEYSKWIDVLRPPPRNPHLNVRLTAPGTSWNSGVTLSLAKENEFYRKTLEVPDDVVAGTRNISLFVSGEGKGTLSYRCTYRTTKDQEVCNYNIIVRTTMIGYRGSDGVSEAASGEGMNVMKIMLEISRNGTDSGMAIIDISLISGFQPVQSSLEAITIMDQDGGGVVDGILDKFEVTNQNVLLYVEKIPGVGNASLQIAFLLQQAVTVLSPSPAKILVYDYYNPEDKCSKFYSVPGGSPLIRSSCMPNSVDAPNERLCRCAEGGCPLCRTREQQLDKTCSGYADCRECGDHCISLRDSVCQRNYGYMANIISINDTSMPQFVKIRASVKEILHTKQISDNPLKNDERIFIIRKDCFDSCHDSGIKTADSSSYFSEGATYLIRGHSVDENTMSSGEKSYDYFLDQNDIVERTLDAEKCQKFEKFRKKCSGSQRNSEKCRTKLEKLRICENQHTMREGIHDGCD